MPESHEITAEQLRLHGYTPSRLNNRCCRIAPGSYIYSRRFNHRRPNYGSGARQGLLKAWHQHWPFSELKLLGYSLVEPDVGDVFTAYSQEYMEHRGQVSAAEAK